MRRSQAAALLLLLLVAGACGGPPATGAPSPPDARHPRMDVALTAGLEAVTSAVAAAADIEALVAPFRDRMDDTMTRVLGVATDELVKGDPEGGLDNLVADAVLDQVGGGEAGPVDAVLLNDGGLRVPLAAGPIRVRNAYELLPFENYITILTFTGRQLDALADEIGRSGGEPIAGWSMVLDGEEARDVRVRGEPVAPEREYRLATVDYLADGGGSWPTLWEPRARQDLPILIRDVFMAYVEGEGEVGPTLDGRIRTGAAEREPGGSHEP